MVVVALLYKTMTDKYEQALGCIEETTPQDHWIHPGVSPGLTRERAGEGGREGGRGRASRKHRQSERGRARGRVEVLDR